MPYIRLGRVLPQVRWIVIGVLICSTNVTNSAQLVLLVEEEDEDGELTFQRRYACGRDETMVEAGAEPNARFIVEIEYDDDD